MDERQFNAGFDGDAGMAKRIFAAATNSGHNGGSLAFGPDGFLYISVGDVGQSSFEELDLVVKGGNYGWPAFEGGLIGVGANTMDRSLPAGLFLDLAY